DWALGVLGVTHGFTRLRHHAVIRCHHEHHDVRYLGTASTHLRKRGVAGRIQERHSSLPRLDRVGADVLRNAAGFTLRYARLTDTIEQTRLTVVNVTHYRHDRRTRFTFFVIAFGCATLCCGDGSVFADGHVFHRPTELFAYDLGSIGIESAVDVDATHAERHQLHQDFAGLDAHFGGECLQRDVAFDAHHLLVCSALLSADGSRAGTARLQLAGATATTGSRLTGAPTRVVTTHSAWSGRTTRPLRRCGTALGVVLNAPRDAAVARRLGHGNARAPLPNVDARLWRRTRCFRDGWT